jgi:hypothetical protein
MKFLDFLIIMLLFVLLGLGSYIFWLNMPQEPVEYEGFYLDNSDLPETGETQFYPNMRYRDRVISYSISNTCAAKQKLDAQKAFSILSDRTLLDFNKVAVGGAEISILCSELSPDPEKEGHFVAGEGGPSEIINISNYAVIFSGKISLYRENDCDNPNVALHEILHALGFDHNTNERSILFPLTKCNQELDDYVIEEINRLYAIDSRVDLAVERITANRSGRYLSFEISVGNFGLKDSDDARLVIYDGENLIRDFELEGIEIGTRKILSVDNLRIPRKSEVISFVVEGFEPELDDGNNRVDVRLVGEE